MADNSAAESARAYWAANLRVIRISLIIWFTCSFGLGILLRPALMDVRIGGADLGLWFAQYGAIYVFIILAFVYAAVMNRIDRKHGMEE